MNEAVARQRGLNEYDKSVLFGIAAAFAAAGIYGAIYGAIVLVAVVGGALAAAALVVALVSKGGTASQVGLPVIGMAEVALLIHAARGHAEAHFAVFAFLAILVAYRRVLPILVGALAIAVHHLSFNYFQQWAWGPVCFLEPSLMRVFEHAAYVIVEAIVLVHLAVRARGEFQASAELADVAADMVRHDGTVDLAIAKRNIESPVAAELAGALRRIGEMIGHARIASDAIRAEAREIATSNESLNARTTRAAEGLQHIVAGIQGVSSAMRDTSDVARSATRLADSASSTAEEGGKAVGQVINNMTRIQQSSQRINEIIGVIDGIAFQTNILALNAAVEAARAGEQGRGFAVVASEVRSLAKRSAEAAREITHLITASVQQVEEGGVLVASAGQTIDRVVAQVREVADYIQQIMRTTAENVASFERIDGAVVNLDNGTQQNAALVENLAAATESMRAQAEQLATSLRYFHVDDIATPVPSGG